ncbi:hypothetical protein COT77_02130 [Candidatus Berkelbacteria bacterium CG10_big_fil_rev_8_21_14_0_10_41_12]|uniref:UPF0235 protein COT77_02130 n=1 Tax=Candidatus Berkelbacteria bacterium CG10_big_fil_rev_8_21_14_0_10_41_12 TaxID=1974513 RepID=A0A2M6WWY8_9BACT|nr:MAG: hypothetical protein COT77_02130 [Candidatus Berkelbacteria bacterium CG10_big_fil_rev_8_21_14_0_10_41_12]
MKISISVKTNAKNSSIEQISKTHFKIHIKSPPAEGKANGEIIKILSKYLKIPKSRISIIHGTRSREKIVDAS